MAAAPLVVPGGVLAYSVCTLTTRETFGVIDSVGESAALTDFVPEAPAEGSWPLTDQVGLLLPGEETDGMALAIWRREA